MFKKTLIAAAITVGFAGNAAAMTLNADVSGADVGWATPTVLAAVTKQAVLDFSTAGTNKDLEMTFNNSNAGQEELKNDGFIVIRINGDASFNDPEVRQWLTANGTGGTAEFSGVGVSGDGTTAISTGVEIAKIFKVTSDSVKDTIDYTVDDNGKRLRLSLADNVESQVAAGIIVNLKLSEANQAFNLTSGSEGTVALDVGVLQNASYTTDPIYTKPLFKLGKLFELESSTKGEATALVSEKFLKYDIGDTGAPVDLDIDAVANLKNLTTNQNIQQAQVALTLTGDFSSFKKNTAGDLLKKDNTNTGWRVVGNKATRKLGAPGVTLAGGASQAINGTLYTLADNLVAIEGGAYSLKAELINGSATFNPFEDTLAEYFLIDRDGMKFDTITTGTSAANQIFVRDISGILPDEGGKIFVTITEYDQHGVNGRGEGNVLVKRGELSTTLPSGGAVTLSPADVAAELDVNTTPGRQARFVFEVETNQGEVAVKKSNSEGVDIKNGTKGVETQKGGNVVDFTL